MEEIRNGRTFAGELGIGRKAKCQTTVARVGCQRAPQFQSRASRYRALFDDQLRRSRFRGNLARDVVNCGKIRIAVFLGRRAHANEYSVAAAYCFPALPGLPTLATAPRRSTHLLP